MTGLSDDARKLLQAGQTALLPARHEVEAIRAALHAKLAAGGGAGIAASRVGIQARLATSAGAGSRLIKLALLTTTVAGLGVGVGYVALRSHAPRPPAAVVNSAPAPARLSTQTQPTATPPVVEDLVSPAREPAAARPHVPARPRLQAPAAASGKAPPYPERPTQGRHALPKAPVVEGGLEAPSTPAATSSAPASGEANTLAQEVELIRKARAHLREGQHARVLRELDAHVERFPNGVLREEQLALRALAWCGLDRLPAARAIIREIRAAAPASPHLAQLERACGAED